MMNLMQFEEEKIKYEKYPESEWMNIAKSEFLIMVVDKCYKNLDNSEKQILRDKSDLS